MYKRARSSARAAIGRSLAAPRSRHPGQEVTIETLTSRQRAFLKSRAHALKPILQIGREGVVEGTVQSVLDALNTRELLKVKVLEGSPQDAREAGAELAARLPGAHVVQVIGRTVVLYREHPESPEIRLPGS